MFDSQHDFTAEPLTTAAPQIGTPRLGQVHHLHAEPLTIAPPQLGTPRLGQVHHLHAEPLTTKPPELGGEPPPGPGVHRLTAAPPRRTRKRDSPRIDLIRTVLRQRVPECSDHFPTVEEMPNRRLQKRLKRIRGPAVRSGSGIKYASLSCELWAERSGNNWSRDHQSHLGPLIF
jgi:hypothetical protein